MPSPFPGMDPYLETPDRWRNVHSNLAAEIQTQLAPLIRPRYYADQEPRFVYDTGLDVVTKHQALPQASTMKYAPNQRWLLDAIGHGPGGIIVGMRTNL